MGWPGWRCTRRRDGEGLWKLSWQDSGWPGSGGISERDELAVMSRAMVVAFRWSGAFLRQGDPEDRRGRGWDAEFMSSVWSRGSMSCRHPSKNGKQVNENTGQGRACGHQIHRWEPATHRCHVKSLSLPQSGQSSPQSAGLTEATPLVLQIRKPRPRDCG